MSLRHFTHLAHRGRLPGASTGEQAARRLALLILEVASQLDSQARDGAGWFLVTAAGNPDAARTVIDADTHTQETH